MRTCTRLLLAVTCGLAATAHAAAADDARAIDVVFHDPGWRVTPSLRIGLEDYHYDEDVAPPLKSRHRAVLPTATIAVEAQSPHGHAYVRASFRATNGSMAFDGSDQAGNAIGGNAGGYLTDTEAVIGGRGGIGDHVWLGGYAGVGHHTWRRDLSTVAAGGYLEEYAWSYVPVAIALDVAPSRRVTVSSDLAVLVPFGTSLIAHFDQISPTYSTLDIPLNTNLEFRVTVGGAYAVTPAFRVTLSLIYEDLLNLQGPGVPFLVNGQPDPNGLFASEPDSKTRRTSLTAGAAYTF